MNKELLIENIRVNLCNIADASDFLGALAEDEARLSQFASFSQMLKETNAVMNLTAITDDEGISVKHFADSLSLFTVKQFKANEKVLDLGTGGGFPGVPLLISCPRIDLTLMDATEKKLRFVASSIESLGLCASTLHARAEEAGRNKLYREKFDTVVSRAVANLKLLSNYCLPFVRVGGTFIAMKGSNAAAEVDEANEIIETLGGKITRVQKIVLSDEIERNLVVIEKVKPTPGKYPLKNVK